MACSSPAGDRTDVSERARWSGGAARCIDGVGSGRARHPSNASSSCTARRTLSVIAIGQAGENQVRFGAWINELDRASGRDGTGAVGGSKQLKTVVIEATR